MSNKVCSLILQSQSHEKPDEGGNNYLTVVRFKLRTLCDNLCTTNTW